MAEGEHVSLLKQGVQAWNFWQGGSPDVRPGLHGADLRHVDLRTHAGTSESGLIGGFPGRCLWASSHRVVDETRLRRRYEAVRGQLDERGRRLFAAAEARAAGYGGMAAVARATGWRAAPSGGGWRIWTAGPAAGQVRRAGSGRPVQEKDPTLLEDLRRLVEPVTQGDPMRPLLWVSKSHAKLAEALCALGHPISPNTVGKLLREAGL